MTLREIVDEMERIAPSSLAEEWDNVGLLCGGMSAYVDTVAVALDATPDIIASAKETGAQLLIVHHPPIFRPIRALSPADPVYQAVKCDLALFAAHTNLDAAENGVNDCLASALELRECVPAGKFSRFGKLPKALTPKAFADTVAEALHTAVQIREGASPVRTVLVSSGAGAESIANAPADAFVTGEIKHHEWLAAPAGMTVLAAGHYATEQVVVRPLCERLQTCFRGLRVFSLTGRAPYETVAP